MKDPKLFAITIPVPRQVLKTSKGSCEPYVDIEEMSPEESIVYMARVSSLNQRTDNAEKLLTYLVQHGHWSPFDMVDMTVEIETSRAIMAQILRHWSFRFQEFSQRYAEVENFDWSHVEARMKAEGGNRQGSGVSQDSLTKHARISCEGSEDDYQSQLNAGAAPESARMILPLATPTRAYMKGSVRSWMTYFWQRCDSHAQKEHRDLADKIFNIFEDEFPIIGNLVRSYKPQVISFNS